MKSLPIENLKSVAELVLNLSHNRFGILTLIVLVLGVLAYFFFLNASERVRVLIFVLVLASGGAFGWTTLQSVSSATADIAAVNALSSKNTQPQSPLEDWNAAQWEVARSHIRWVFQAPRPRAIYALAQANGLSRYDSVLAAQGHHPDSQQHIRQYGEARTERFISSFEP
jgi:hypothetical protein